MGRFGRFKFFVNPFSILKMASSRHRSSTGEPRDTSRIISYFIQNILHFKRRQNESPEKAPKVYGDYVDMRIYQIKSLSLNREPIQKSLARVVDITTFSRGNPEFHAAAALPNETLRSSLGHPSSIEAYFFLSLPERREGISWDSGFRHRGF